MTRRIPTARGQTTPVQIWTKTLNSFWTLTYMHLYLTSSTSLPQSLSCLSLLFCKGCTLPLLHRFYCHGFSVSVVYHLICLVIQSITLSLSLLPLYWSWSLIIIMHTCDLCLPDTLTSIHIPQLFQGFFKCVSLDLGSSLLACYFRDMSDVMYSKQCFCHMIQGYVVSGPNIKKLWHRWQKHHIFY